MDGPKLNKCSVFQMKGHSTVSKAFSKSKTIISQEYCGPQCDLLCHQLIFCHEKAGEYWSLLIMFGITFLRSVFDGFYCYFVATVQKGYRMPGF